MPTAGLKDRAVVREGFLRLVSSRNAVAGIWHGLLPLEQVAWPQWSREAFERERQDWLMLSESTVGHQDRDVHHWGRYARLAASRLQAGGWQSPQAPLRHARMQLLAVMLLDPKNQEGVLERTVKELASWLDRLPAERGVDPLERAQLVSQADALGMVVAKAVETCQDSQLTVLPIREAVGRYMDRVPIQDFGADPIPWRATAHVNTWKWHQRREQFVMPALAPIPKVSVDQWIRDLDSCCRGDGKEAPWHVERVAHLGTQSWVRLFPKPTVYGGAQSYGPLLLSRLLCWWADRATADPLTWLLSDPPALEAGLYGLAGIVGSDTTLPVVSLAAQHYRVLCDVLAVADAWLWLEGADPDQVATWLGQWFKPADAWRWALSLSSDVSRKVAAAELDEEHGGQVASSGWEWDGWDDGPIRWVAP
ncbi:hypothetical protein [Sulfobacillus sp. hq2]|uniref:hypothetical protein n=1 Tax=Sulfobacillus sp. hq2 TaxID=2039167 RepID=UPI000CD2AD8D|nr:hypothetical protein [Sulfobacillus sp. hq2]POB10010.1 hypothetical protein CO251_12430 [Sulfobacillus sp. hq2]